MAHATSTIKLVRIPNPVVPVAAGGSTKYDESNVHRQRHLLDAKQDNDISPLESIIIIKIFGCLDTLDFSRFLGNVCLHLKQ